MKFSNIYYLSITITNILMTKKKNYYPSKSVNIEPSAYEKVIEHIEKEGFKIGKFFSIAAVEKMERDRVSVPVTQISDNV